MKVLVVFGSERGGTAGLAQMIGAEFERRGITAEVRNATAPGPVDADVVVIGGALYLDRWHSDARHFVRRRRLELAGKRVWLFSSGPLDDSARAGDLAPVTQVRELAAAIDAHGHMTFGGRLEPGAKGLIARSMARKLAGDYRDPAQVAEWVAQICHALAPTVTPAAPIGAVSVPQQRGRTRQHAPG
jgi:menaquinone-dependent protoporphyrinogen oxidase